MFRITEVSVKGWCQHKDLTVPFIDGTNGIIGANGRGKSNLIGAIFTGITGRCIVGNLEDNINFEGDSAAIAIKFLYNDTDGVIERKFSAKRMPDGTRDRLKSTARLEYGGKKLTSVTKVNEEIVAITGLKPGVVENHVFISQDTLRSLLFQKKSDRLKSFLELLPELSRIHTIGDLLLNEHSQFQEMDVSVSITETLAAISAVEKEVDELSKPLEVIDIQGKKQIADGAVKLLERWNRRQEKVKELEALQRDYNVVTKQLDDAVVAMSNADTTLAEVTETRDALSGTAALAERELAALKQNAIIYETRNRAEAEAAKLVSEVGSRSQPDPGGSPWTDIPALEKEQMSWLSELNQHQKKLKVLTEGGSCPTCGNVFLDPHKHLIESTAQLTKLKECTDRRSVQISALRLQESTYRSALAAYTQWSDSAQRQLVSLQETLNKLPKVVKPDESRIHTLGEELTKYKNILADYDTADRDAQNCKSHFAVINSKYLSLQERITKASDAMEDISSEQAAAAEAVVREYEAVYNKYVADKATLASKQAELNRLRGMADRLAQTMKATEAVKAYRELLVKSRNILHPTRLPQAVLQSYVGTLESICNKFLEAFGRPFTVSIEEDMELTCVMPNGYSPAADRLSGGQKCVLSVAMRFAINELFARDLGLIVLDEPTEYLDNDNIEYMRTLMEMLKGISKASRVQTIVITHRHEFMTSFDNLVKVP
jgi:DNA repair exonuclease SbcCD ATPase subunit